MGFFAGALVFLTLASGLLVSGFLVATFGDERVGFATARDRVFFLATFTGFALPGFFFAGGTTLKVLPFLIGMALPRVDPAPFFVLWLFGPAAFFVTIFLRETLEGASGPLPLDLMVFPVWPRPARDGTVFRAGLCCLAMGRGKVAVSSSHASERCVKAVEASCYICRPFGGALLRKGSWRGSSAG